MYFLVCATLAFRVWADTVVDVPSNPATSWPTVDPSFPNLALELASLVNFAQTAVNDTSPNQYSINLINEIFKRTGGYPIIRVGGTSADYYIYNPAQSEPVLPVPRASANQQNVNTTIGPNFWPLTQNFGGIGAKWIPQVSLAENDLTQIALQAKGIADGIGLENIESLEIGNEPNFYPLGGTSPPEYTGKLDNYSYSDRFKKYAATVSEAIPINNGSMRIFQAGDVGFDVSNPENYPLNVPGIFEAGIDTDHIVKSVAAHYYQISRNDIPGVMNHSASVYQFKPLKQWVDFLTAYECGCIPLVIDEASVYTGPSASNNITFRSSLGAALWRSDFLLYTMSIGVKRVHWESVFASGQTVFEPQASEGLPAETRSGYYSLLLAAEFIGNTGGITRVGQLPINGTLDNAHFTTYAAYSGTELVRIAVVNLNYWDNSTAVRPDTVVTLSGLTNSKNILVKYLTSPQGGAAASDQITYGDSQWTYESQGLEVSQVSNNTLTMAIVDGLVSVPISYSSAAVIFLQP